jgi:CRISPR-associated protein Cas2
MAASQSWHLICYDVRHPKRLRKTAKVLEGYGERVQYSIFRIRVTEHKLQKVRWELSEILTQDDSLLIIPLCQRCSSKVDELSHGCVADWGGEPPSFDIL